MKQTNTYSVLVGNVGDIKCENMKKALTIFSLYVADSKSPGLRASGENVTLLRNDEPFKEYIGAIEQMENAKELKENGPAIFVPAPVELIKSQFIKTTNELFDSVKETTFTGDAARLSMRLHRAMKILELIENRANEQKKNGAKQFEIKFYLLEEILEGQEI